MNDIFAYILQQFAALDLSLNWTDVIQIVFLVVILLFAYKKFIKNTQSEKFVKGLLIIVFVWVFSEVLVRLDLKIFGMFLKSIVTLVTVSLIVIFQPELRRFLGFLGQVDRKSTRLNSSHSV